MSGIQITFNEKAVEDLLQNNCEHWIGLKFLKRQFRTPVGIIDVIARHPDVRNTYYVIEIKKDLVDPYAFAQVSRYAKWLNSFYTKGPRRIFIPILIGAHLHGDLTQVCEYFNEDKHSGLGAFGSCYYRLFDFDPMRGVSFDFSSNAENIYRDSLDGENSYNHIENLVDKLEYLEWEFHRSRVITEPTLVKGGAA